MTSSSSSTIQMAICLYFLRPGCNPSVPRGVRCCGLLLSHHLRQRFLGANVMRLSKLQFLLSRHVTGDGHKAVEAARIVAAVLVLGAAIGGAWRQHFPMLAPEQDLAA